MDHVVLYLQQFYRNDVFALHAVNDNNVNKGYRHAAYRQFILWMYGRLTAGDRRIISSCVVCKIRDNYPDSNNNYKGYVPGRLF